jgi:hypothetical protein
MRQVAMTVFSLQEAVERTGTSKVDIWRAIQAGALSAKKTDDGGFEIDPADLFAAFTKHTDQRPMAEDAAASAGASECTETTSEIAATNDIAVAFATLGTELKGLLELPAEPPAPATGEPRQNRDQKPIVDLAERNAQLAEPAIERAKVGRTVAYVVLADEHGKPWWRRLVGWLQTRRRRAASKRLRERL